MIKNKREYLLQEIPFNSEDAAMTKASLQVNLNFVDTSKLEEKKVSSMEKCKTKKIIKLPVFLIKSI